MQLQKIFRYIVEHKEEHLERLQQFLQQPSVSPQNIGIQECAKLVARYFKELGCGKVRIVSTKGNPVVYGSYDAEAEKTLLVYFMYDTQPYDEPGWTCPPMEATLVPMELPSGRVTALINRGAENTKGPMMAFLNALEAIKAVEGNLPVNLKLVAEGEEELGSPHLPDFIKEYKRELSQAEACFFPAFCQDQYGKVQLYLGNKGIVYFELECSGKEWGRGPEEFDIHSSHKAWIDSPVWRMVQALATMTDKSGNKILIEGFYDDVAEPSSEEEELIKKLVETFDPKAVKEMNKVSRFVVDEKDKAKLIKEYLFGTTLNIDGLWSGYTGPGSKTVLPHKVTAKLDVRLVPKQRPERILNLIRKHLDEHGYNDIKLMLMDSYGWAQTELKADVVEAVIKACRAFGYEPEI